LILRRKMPKHTQRKKQEYALDRCVKSEKYSGLLKEAWAQGKKARAASFRMRKKKQLLLNSARTVI
jgi:hypothetical protein